MTVQEAINVFKELLSVPKEMIIKYDSVVNEEQKEKLNKIYTAQQLAIEALEKQIPKKPKHIHEEYKKHQWKKNKKGEVDDWAWGSGFCNGVVCERCGETICVHCNPNYDEKPCVVDKDVCPICGNEVYRYQKKSYCDECGQALDWSEEG